jgi:UDP-N-acetylmuramate dehydrogenase
VSDPIEVAERILRAACGPRLRSRRPLADLTSFRIGGPAALYLEAATAGDLEAAARAIEESSLPWVTIGRGSNLLVSDRGFPGLVVRLGRGYRSTTQDDNRLIAGAAMPLPALAGAALAGTLAGLEWGVAIPGTVGGGVRMNAGAHRGSMANVLEEIELFSMGEGTGRRIPAADASFGYRHSDLPAGTLVVGATFLLAAGRREDIRARMAEAREWRRATQPLAESSCGSVFKNPPGDHAGRLVDAAGCKGLTVGGAEVSRKHANFIVTQRGATAADVDRLIRRVQRAVEERFAVVLETEVHRVGQFDLASL